MVEFALSLGEQSSLPATFSVNTVDLPVWPRDQSCVSGNDQRIALTRFVDFGAYHSALIDAVLAAEKDPRFGHPTNNPMYPIVRGGCGSKVRKLPQWKAPAAALVHARALMLAHHTLSGRAVFVDEAWASVYRVGDYCVPHSHLRSTVSIIYMLDPGEIDPEDKLAGLLWFTDPRIAWCCPSEPGRVTRPFVPVMTPGAMLIFSSDYLHGVSPYHGARPRITLSWNITLERLPGVPLPGLT